MNKLIFNGRICRVLQVLRDQNGQAYGLRLKAENNLATLTGNTPVVGRHGQVFQMVAMAEQSAVSSLDDITQKARKWMKSKAAAGHEIAPVMDVALIPAVSAGALAHTASTQDEEEEVPPDFWGDGGGFSLDIADDDEEEEVPSGFWGGGWGFTLDIDQPFPKRTDPCGCKEKGAQNQALAANLRDGLYRGGNHRLALDLRVDFDGSGVISGDLAGTEFGTHTPLASFRTAPGTRVRRTDEQTWPAVFERPGEAALAGLLTLKGGAGDGAVLCRLRVDGPLPGLPKGAWVDLVADWQSLYMRRIGIEIEREVGTDGPPAYIFDGRPITYQSVLRNAGFDVFENGRSDVFASPPGGWGATQLLTAMLDRAARLAADVPLGKPAWQSQLLWLDQPSRSGLFGVMFDTSAQLPRQGAAVFEGEIKELRPADAERRIIRTTAHEIGHALNLVHRFERNVGRADSLSIMNYDQRYRGGGRSEEYWSKFAFTFDDDELAFLRHGPRHHVIPGGSAFHSVNYWADANGGYVPYLPETPLEGWALELSAPTDTYMFGQPVFMKVDLINLSGQLAELDRRILDPKGDFLSIHVQRISQSPFRGASRTHFHPIMERCFDDAGVRKEMVPHGERLSNNIQVFYGSGGFTFAEPGVYDIRVVGAVPVQGNPNDPKDDRELIAVSNRVRIRVQPPYSQAEEREVTNVLHRPDVGTYIAMGGAYALEAAHDDLRAVCARRMGRRKTVGDPIVAAILRCQGIDLARDYARVAQNGAARHRACDPQGAATLLADALDARVPAFDAETRETTRRLLLKNQRASKKG